MDLRVIENPNSEAFLPALARAEIWVQRGAIAVDDHLLSYAPRLHTIIRAGSGTEHIDKAAIESRRIHLYSTPYANAMPVAEYVLTAILLLTRRFLMAHHALRESGRWERQASIGRELHTLTIGIVGFGENGSRTAHLLAALGARVLAYDKYKGGFGGLGVKVASLEELFEAADVISLHIPLTDETKGWVDGAFLARFQHPIALINPARGGIVRLPDVVKALKAGQLWGLAMDTLPAEPPERLALDDREAFEELRRHPAVLLTPHIAGLTEESELRLAQAVLTLLTRLLPRHSNP